MYSKPLSESDSEELAALNCAVDEAIKARTDWLDSKMEQYAECKIGDTVLCRHEYSDIYLPIGKVSRFYRYWAGRNALHDTSLEIHVEFETRKNCFDNSSRGGLGLLKFESGDV